MIIGRVELLTILILFLLGTSVNAQTAREYLSPVASPQASVSQNVGMTNITIKYSSPGVKGRTIFGYLVPYNELWRAGANSPTIIVFSTDVKIEGGTSKDELIMQTNFLS